MIKSQAMVMIGLMAGLEMIPSNEIEDLMPISLVSVKMRLSASHSMQMMESLLTIKLSLPLSTQVIIY